MTKQPKSSGAKRTVAQVLNGNGSLDIRGLEALLWEAACSIRGPVEAPKFKDYILPLVFIKRLSDVYEDELTALTKDLGIGADAESLVARDHALVRFFLPAGTRWTDLRAFTTDVGQRLTDTTRKIAKENASLQGVIDVVDFNATISGQRIIDDSRLMRLVERLSKHRLGLADVEPDILGRAYEYLLRKFAEGQGTSAGEHFTPKEVGWLLARIVRPTEGMEIHDPAAGSAGLLVKQQLWLHQLGHIDKPLHLYGQEINHTTYAIGKMNMMVHDLEGEMAIGDTLVNPRFTVGGKLRLFDIVVANPMWNQPDYDAEFYDADGFDRFTRGQPPARSADWGWLQHMLKALKADGRAAVVLDAAAVTRGSGGDSGNRKEKGIRARFVDEDLLEAVILLPEDIFYNTPAQGVVVVINKAKPHKNEVLLIDASAEFVRERPKNVMTEAGIARVTETFDNWVSVPGLSAVVPKTAVVERDYNLNPGRYVGRHVARARVDLEASLSSLAVLRTEVTRLDADVVAFLTELQKGAGTDDKPPAGWVDVVFEDVAEFKLGRTPARKNTEYWPGHGEEGDVPWVTITDMAGRRIVSETKEKITQCAFDEIFKEDLVPTGTLLMSFKLTIGRTAFMGADGVHNEAIISIMPAGDQLNDRFLYHYLPLIDYAQYQDRAVKGQTLNSGKIKKMTLRLPPLSEQRSIADLLDHVQSLVDLERRIVTERAAFGEELVRQLLEGSARIISR